jgi:hypothetical protein
MVDTVWYEFLYRWHIKTVTMYDLNFINFHTSTRNISTHPEIVNPFRKLLDKYYLSEVAPILMNAQQHTHKIIVLAMYK